MGLFRLHVSYTEGRRRRLARKTDQLDRLESRTAVAEPLSFTGLGSPQSAACSSLGSCIPMA